MEMDNKQETAVRVVINGEVIQDGFESLQEAMEWAQVFVKNATTDPTFEKYEKPKLLLD